MLNPTKYNALDNKEKAQALMLLLQLERQDLNSSLEYDHATSVCSGCPNSWNADELSFILNSCCKDDGSWDEQNQSAYQHLERIDKCILSLSRYIDPEATAQLFPPVESAQLIEVDEILIVKPISPDDSDYELGMST